MPNYSAQATRVAAQIAKFGAPAVLERALVGEYDPNFAEPDDDGTQVYNTVAVRASYAHRRSTARRYKAGDVRLYVSPGRSPPSRSPATSFASMAPNTSSSIVEPVKPATVVVATTCRRAMPETREGKFAVSVSNWTKKAQGNADQVLRAVCIGLLNNVVVRSGRQPRSLEGRQARLHSAAAWLRRRQISRELAGTSVGAPRPRRATPSTRPARSRFKPARVVIDGVKCGPPVYIVNNLPYAISLEYGHSTQAPLGMARLAALEFQQIVNQRREGAAMSEDILVKLIEKRLQAWADEQDIRIAFEGVPFNPPTEIYARVAICRRRRRRFLEGGTRTLTGLYQVTVSRRRERASGGPHASR
jgi:hypothetical protein